MNIHEYEQAMKTVSKLTRMTGELAKSQPTLQEKLFMQGEHQELQNIETLLRKKYFAVEHIIEAHKKVEFCGECKAVV